MGEPLTVGEHRVCVVPFDGVKLGWVENDFNYVDWPGIEKSPLWDVLVKSNATMEKLVLFLRALDYVLVSECRGLSL